MNDCDSTKKNQNESSQNQCCSNFDYSLAFLVLRGWLAVRAMLTGIEKFGAYQTIQKPLIDPTTGMEDPSGAMVDVKIKFYSLTNYSGIPAPLKDKFANEPLLPQVCADDVRSSARPGAHRHRRDVVAGPGHAACLCSCRD